MQRNSLYMLAAGLASIALAFGLGVAVGQQTPPTETKGVKVSPPTALDLGPEVDSVEGRQLRLRVVTVEPGGVVAVHSHKGRPGVAYIVQGTLTETREGAPNSGTRARAGPKTGTPRTGPRTRATSP